ncbi:flippase [Pleurocapsales cyanobacterium LEGE 10410]|nr:flippase [Pleurocapsales cyanobacterium LEGE 10410]
MQKKFRGIGNKLSPGLRKIVGNVGWLTLEKLLSVALNLTIGIYVIRYLGSDDFGKLSYCLSLVGMFGAIAKLGLDHVVVRNLVQEEESTPEILGTALVLKLIGSLATSVLIVCVVLLLNQDPQIHWITIVIALGLVFRTFEVINFWFQSKVLSRSIVIVRSLKLILSSAVKLLFIFLGLPLSAFVWLLLADEIVLAVTTVWTYIIHTQLEQQLQGTNFVPSPKRWTIWRWKLNSSRAVAMLRDSWPLILAGVMVTIYMKIDQVMLGNMTSNEVVGNYAAAIKFSEVWYFVPTAVCASVFPSILRAKQRGKQEYYGKIQQLYDLMAWMSLAIAVIMTFASGVLVNMLLGTEYSSAGQILAWHIWAGPFVFLGVARDQWLMAENLTKLSFATTSLGTIANLLLNFWLIPIYGGSGAAIATVISYAVAAYFASMIYPVMFHNTWMLTKALFVPFRVKQNLSYLAWVRNILF